MPRYVSGTIYAGYTTKEEQEQLQRLERQLKRRLPVGTQVSLSALNNDLLRQRDTTGAHDRAAAERQLERVLQLMLRRGEIQCRMQRKMIYPLKRDDTSVALMTSPDAISTFFNALFSFLRSRCLH